LRAELEHDLRLFAEPAAARGGGRASATTCGLTLRQVQGSAAEHLLTRHDDVLRRPAADPQQPGASRPAGGAGGS